ncbi:MAG: hypothetical protein OEN01_07280 [Candidatus Krumholzibacteria bacterium]|nr:hypothetical protein [Candidatus Krumholzibacteria bacterium]
MSLFRLLVVTLLLPAVSSSAWASPFAHGWSQRFGDASDQFVSGLATDASGNVVVAGRFLGSVDFGGGLLTSAGSFDVYIAKFDASGVHQWSQRFGDALFQEVGGIAVDATGNVIVTGYFDGTVDFGGGPLVSAGNFDIYIAKFNASGAHLWSQRFGDTSDQYGAALATDNAGNVILAGYFAGTVSFDGGPNPLVSVGGLDICVAKFNASGVPQWSQRFGEASDQYARAVAVAATGNIVVTGRFRDKVDFGGGILTSAGQDDVYLAGFDASGAHLWSQRFGDVFDEAAAGVSVDASGNVILAGDLSGTADFGGGPLTSAGDFDVFLAKFNASGVHLWSQRFGDASEQYGIGVAVDASGNVVLTGYYSGTVDFGGGPLNAAGHDAYVSRFDAFGNHLWSERFGDALGQFGIGVAVDAAQNLLVTGHFEGTADFGGGTLTSAGLFDVFLAKFWRAAPDIVAVRDVPGDQGGFVNVAWDGSGADTPAEHQISSYTLWRAIPPSLASQISAGGGVIVRGPSLSSEKIGDRPVVRVDQAGGSSYYWFLIDSYPAYYLPGYSAPAPTLFDSTSVSNEYHYFQVIAHTADPLTFFTSDPDSGYSIDNLVPASPQGLAGRQTGGAEFELTWDPNDEADLSHYAVYRESDPGFVPGPANRLGTVTTTVFVDPGWSWGPGYTYKLTAVDVHENESPPAVLGPGVATGVGGTGGLKRFALYPSVPNPFNPTTLIRYDVPAGGGEVSIKVYRVDGGLVRTLLDAIETGGAKSVAWDGRDDSGARVASGVYFYRMSAGGFSQTKRMVLLK